MLNYDNYEELEYDLGSAVYYEEDTYDTVCVSVETELGVEPNVLWDECYE